MKSRPRHSTPSSANCEALELRGAPRLAALLACHALGLPVLLLTGGYHRGVAVGLCLLVLAAACAPAWRRLRGPRAGRPRFLLWNAEGQLFLRAADGTLLAVVVAPRSLVEGPWMVLLLDGARGREVVVLEAPGLPPASRASLRRALRRAAAANRGRHHALRSLLERGEPGP